MHTLVFEHREGPAFRYWDKTWYTRVVTCSNSLAKGGLLSVSNSRRTELRSMPGTLGLVLKWLSSLGEQTKNKIAFKTNPPQKITKQRNP